MSGSKTPLSVLKETFGFDAFRGDQLPIIEHVTAGGDGLVIMPTGGGKSLCYQVPALIRRGVAIVVSPLIALMADQVAALRQYGIRAAYINSSLDAQAAYEAEQAMRAGELELVYVAPERLCTPRFLKLLDQTPLSLFAIDEAHCVSQWGHDFRPEYRQLSILHQRFPSVPRLALTATADQPTREDIIERLDLDEARQFIGGFDRPNIRYRVTPKSGGVRQVIDYLRHHRGKSGIVYCMSRAKTEDVAAKLVEAGFKALAYHAGLDRAMRDHHQQRFSNEPDTIIVATIAFGMGIDKPDVRFVVHTDLPKSIEAYYQETGRAGRDGLPAEALLTYSVGDATKIRRFIDSGESPDAQKQIEHRKLNALLGFCETITCRRRVLLEYFGQSLAQPCGNCDACLEPIEQYDGTEDAQKALSNVYRTDQRYGAGHLADVLIGSESEKVIQAGHHEVSTYGIGRDKTRAQWQSIYRQLIAMGLLDVCREFGSLWLTEAALPVLRGEQDVALRKDRPKIKRDRSGRATGTVAGQLQSATDRKLFDALRAKRSELAAGQSVPAYVVFADKSLVDMALRKPASLEQMACVHGVGRAKLQRYGELFVEVIQSHINDHGHTVAID